MGTSKVLLSSNEFTKEFIRCCKTYSKLNIAVAWCGNPDILTYLHLENFKGKIEVILGTSFYHTHPAAFDWFKKINCKLRVYDDKHSLFHPKIYLFSIRDKYALFIGSSNLTDGGFSSNIEANLLIQGNIAEGVIISNIKNQLELWNRDEFSFNPSKQWLVGYKRKYYIRRSKEKKAGLYTAERREEELGRTSWFRNNDWDKYYQKLKSGINKNEYDIDGYFHLISKSREKLKIPWKISYFNDKENRNIMGGRGEYASLGHVVSSGWLADLIANGPKSDWQILINAINKIARMETPLNYQQFELELNKLTNLGFTMKVWGRFLCLVRPDLYCTVSSNYVRKNLAESLHVSQASFTTPEGYIKLIKMIHSSPWFNSPKPKKNDEIRYWNNRVALLDGILYKYFI